MKIPAEIVYVYNPSRAHKLLPLLVDFSVIPVKEWRDVWGLRRRRGNVVVLVDNFGTRGLLAVAASVLLRAPLVVRLRGEYFREERERTAARRGLLRWPRYSANVFAARLCLKKARMAICNSRYLAEKMAPYTGSRPTPIVHNPYTPLEPRPAGRGTPDLPPAGLRLLSITNMNLRSKVEPLAEAIRQGASSGLWEEMDVRWVICGTGYHEQLLRDVIRGEGLEDRIRLAGRVEAVSSLYERCDILVHLTRMDAFPNVPMEAMVQGRPVIANADSCGTREQVFDGKSGLIVDDAASFASALKAYAGDPALRERHARAGRLLVEERFSVEAQRRAMNRALGGLLPGS